MSDTPTPDNKEILLIVRRQLIAEVGTTERQLAAKRATIRTIEERLGLPGGEIHTMTGGVWVVTPRDETLDKL